MSDVPNVPDDKPAGPADKKDAEAVNGNGAAPGVASPAANDNPAEEPAPAVETVVTETAGGDQPAADNAEGGASPTVTGSTTQIVTRTTTKKTITRTTTKSPARKAPRKPASSSSPKSPRKPGRKTAADATVPESGDAKPIGAAILPAQPAANDTAPALPPVSPPVEPVVAAEPATAAPAVAEPVPASVPEAPAAETPAEVPAGPLPTGTPAENAEDIADIPSGRPAEIRTEPAAETIAAQTPAVDAPVAEMPAAAPPVEEKTAEENIAGEAPAQKAPAEDPVAIDSKAPANPENGKGDTPWVDEAPASVPPLNTADKTAADMPAPKRGLLSRIFNAETGRHVISFATGMATTMAISGLTRTAVFSAATAAGLSTAPALIGAALVAGFVLGNYRFIKQRRDAVRAGSPVHEKGSKDFWKQYRNTVLTSTVLAGAGGAFSHYCMPSVVSFVSDKAGWAMDRIHDGLGHLFNGHVAPDHGTMVPPAGPIAVIPPEHVPDAMPDHAVPDHAPVDMHVEPAPVPETHAEPQVEVKPDPVEPHIEVKPEPVVPVAPEVVVPAEPTAADRLLEFKNTHHLSRSMQKLFDRALNGNAQAEKDIAYFLFNGFKGMPKDQDLAVTLFKHAASLGNVQAQVDDSYIQYWGLAHQAAHPAESLAKMQELAHVDHRAARLSDAWKAAGRHIHHHVAKHAASALRPH